MEGYRIRLALFLQTSHGILMRNLFRLRGGVAGLPGGSDRGRGLAAALPRLPLALQSRRG